jgi:DNA replication protein DnaC
MNPIELKRSLVQLRLSGMAAVLETRLLQAQSEAMGPIDLISILVSDELACRSKRLLERRHKQAQFRDPNKQLDNFDFQFNPKMNRSLIFDLATAAWIGRREDALFLGPAGSGKSHCAQAIGQAVIQQGLSRVVSRSTHPAGGVGRRHTGRQPQATCGTAYHCAASHHRRSGNA